MNRRSFFRLGSLFVGAASVAPQIFIPKFGRIRWKKSVQAVRVQMYCRTGIQRYQIIGRWRTTDVRMANSADEFFVPEREDRITVYAPSRQDGFIPLFETEMFGDECVWTGG
jgi:hypothetical protein